MAKIIFAVHGGAGNGSLDIAAQNYHTQQIEFIKNLLIEAFTIYQRGVSALDLVEYLIKELEDFPGFNAGKGAVLTSAGTVECDASIMDGHKQLSGAIACVKHIKNPIACARRVMDASQHHFLVGDAADHYAHEQGLEIVTQDYFITEKRQDELRAISEKRNNDHHDSAGFGTVGAVVLDANGHLAAGTSTGGKANQLPGRVGDSPIVGSGTWADKHCALSATGDGEAIMRCVLTHRIALQMQLQHLSLEDACVAGFSALEELGGLAGCIALDNSGNFCAPYNTKHMYHGYVDEAGTVTVKV